MALFGVPPLVRTLAIVSIVNGGLIIFESIAQQAIAASPLLAQLAGRTTLGAPNIFLLWIAIGLVAVWFLSATAWGGKVFSTGANARVALLSGTHVQLVKISVYAISGFIAALSGFCLIGYVGAAFLGLRDACVLSSIVVAVMGGMSLAGGRGSHIGVAAAAILITVLTRLLTTMQIRRGGTPDRVRLHPGCLPAAQSPSRSRALNVHAVSRT